MFLITRCDNNRLVFLFKTVFLLRASALYKVNKVLTAPASIKVSVGVGSNATGTILTRTCLPPHSVLQIQIKYILNKKFHTTIPKKPFVVLFSTDFNVLVLNYWKLMGLLCHRTTFLIWEVTSNKIIINTYIVFNIYTFNTVCYFTFSAQTLDLETYTFDGVFITIYIENRQHKDIHCVQEIGHRGVCSISR